MFVSSSNAGRNREDIADQDGGEREREVTEGGGGGGSGAGGVGGGEGGEKAMVGAGTQICTRTRTPDHS